MGERLVIHRLLLRSSARDYEVVFHDGVNIVAGPIFTGKSSVLQFIDYCLGSKRQPRYPEARKLHSACLEIDVGGEVLTICRGLNPVDANATVFEGKIDAVLSGKLEGVRVSASHVSTGESISSQVMGRLGLGGIQVKSAPTQDSSGLSAFTIRDLLSFLYVNQDRMGATSGFYEENFAKAIKWRYAFQIIHRIFDQVLANAASALRDAEAEHARIETYLRNARDFLQKAGVPSTDKLIEERRELLEAETVVLAKIDDLVDKRNERLGDNKGLAEQYAALKRQLAEIDASAEERRSILARLERLLVQYRREEGQLDLLAEGERVFTSLPVVACPACMQVLPEPDPHVEHCHVCRQALPDKKEGVSVDRRLRAVRGRIRDLEAYIRDLKGDLDSAVHARRSVGSVAQTLAESLAILERQQLLPLGRQLTESNVELTRIRSRLAEAGRYLELRDSARGQGTSLLAVAERVHRLRRELADLKEKQPDADSVFAGLASIFRDLLVDVEFPQAEPIGVERGTYLPLVRGEVYSHLSSKGAISVAMAVYLLANLIFSLESKAGAHPAFIMLDSPLLALGRDAADPAFRDQVVVDAYYALLDAIHRSYADRFQLIMVDNRPPRDYLELVAIEFTRKLDEGRFGLIDDETGGDAATRDEADDDDAVGEPDQEVE